MKKYFIIGLLALCILFLNVCSLIESIELEEYQAYLEDKYGKDKGFYMVRENTCNWFELGYCNYSFSSNELNGETFTINGTLNVEKPKFEDNYIAAKYKNQLELYYKQLFDSTLGVDCKIDDIYAFSYNLNPNASFEEFLKYEDLDLSIYLDSLYADFDRETLKAKTKELIESNGIKNVKQIKSAGDVIYERLEVK